MNRFGITAASEGWRLYSVSSEKAMDKFGMTAVTDCASAHLTVLGYSDKRGGGGSVIFSNEFYDDNRE